MAMCADVVMGLDNRLLVLPIASPGTGALDLGRGCECTYIVGGQAFTPHRATPAEETFNGDVTTNRTRKLDFFCKMAKEMDVDPAPGEATTEPVQTFSLHLLQIVRAAQGLHGLKHSEYVRYRYVETAFRCPIESTRLLDCQSPIAMTPSSQRILLSSSPSNL